MPRVMKPLPNGKGAPPRSPQGDGGTTRTERPHLRIVRLGVTACPPPHRGMWHDDPDKDHLRGTALEDWPSDQEFDPLITGAVTAGDLTLAAQLEADRAFCAAARATLSQPIAFPRDSTA